MRQQARSSLRDGLEDLEAERFVGRRAQLAAIAGACASERGGIVFVHGRAGVGKSGLLRAALARAQASGRPTVVLAAAPDSPRTLELLAAGDLLRPLVVIDDFAVDPVRQAWLRETVLPSLPAGSVLLVAGRRAPPATWLAGTLGSSLRTLELEPLGTEDAQALLAARGLEGAAADAAIAWGQGWPVALVLAAAAGGEPPGAATIAARLAGEELDALAPEVVALAALLRIVDRRALVDVGQVDEPDATLRELERMSVFDRRPGGVELHPLLRQALREQLREVSPNRERELRRRLADHLHLRARTGEGWLVVDLAELIEDPAVRWGYGGGGGGDLRAGTLHADELGTVERTVTERWDASWWEGTRRWLVEAPETAVVVRDGRGTLRGLCVATSLRRLPGWAGEDQVLARWIAHAEAASPIGDAVLWRDVVAFDDDRDNRVRALLNATAALRSGAVNPRWFYGPVDPTHEREMALSQAVGARHLADLDVEANGRRLECHVIDHGPGGVLGLARDLVYRELGLAPRRPPSPEQVQTALRSLRRPEDLAGSPFTSDGLERTEQTREVRARLTGAAAEAFGPDPEDSLLRGVLGYAYLDEGTVAASGPVALNISRATYYRRLNAATDRLARHLADHF